ncbi:lysylphosphatidylglycerol synthase transmembrane domain-containing protein [Candidatus Solincola sp.]|nr:flippase-like domain-containing protein [Actinomycetota bacterium]MDI7251652.1 flippase-like domain-containing protein [Actinomycetota bacterium]
MEEEPLEEKGLSVSRSRMRRGLVAAVSISTATLVVIFLSTMGREIPAALSRLSPFYLVLAVALSLGRWLWSALRMRILVRAVDGDVPFPHLLKTVYGGYFTGMVTPWRAGGVTGEALFLYQYGLGAGEAAAVVSFGACVSALLLMLSFPPAIWLAQEQFQFSFTVKGFLFSALAVGLLFLALVLFSLLHPQAALDRVLLRLSPSFLRRRDGYRRLLARLGEEVRSFSSSLRRMVFLGKARLAAVTALTFLFWLTGFLAVPFALVGLGYGSYFWKSMVAQLVVQILMPFVPTPGGSGLGEVGFLYVYSRVLPDAGLAGLLTLIWRFVDFYLGILVGGTAFLLILKDVERHPREPMKV